MEVAFARRPSTLEAAVGTAWKWPAHWGLCWLLLLNHPSPVNGACWRRNKLFLQKFLKECSDPALCLVKRRGERPEVKGDSLNSS